VFSRWIPRYYMTYDLSVHMAKVLIYIEALVYSVSL
jgi:hypothetical protein